MANDHKHLPGFSDRNVRRYLPSHNPNIPHRVRTPRPKNSITKAVDNPKLSVSKHKQNELIDACISTHIETSSSTVWTITLQEYHNFKKTRTNCTNTTNTPPTMTSKSTIDHPSYNDNRNQVQNDNLLTFEFWLPVREVLGYFIPIIPKKEHTEDQIWFSGILDKCSGRVISAPYRKKKDLIRW